MKRAVSLRVSAMTDLRDARDWYERNRPGLGDEFHLCVADALTQLEESPESFPIYYRGFRRLLMERFPYKVFYRIEDDSVIVFRILHAARDASRQLN